jgi:23S rRNA (adenine2503-C2)-methyltransferase
VALAYLLLAGENDSAAELAAFAALARPLGVAVHLYQHNAVASSSLHGATREAYERAYEQLRAEGLVVRMSSQARIEANGGCGTLVAAGQLRRGHARTSS